MPENQQPGQKQTVTVYMLTWLVGQGVNRESAQGLGRTRLSVPVSDMARIVMKKKTEFPRRSSKELLRTLDKSSSTLK